MAAKHAGATTSYSPRLHAPGVDEPPAFSDESESEDEEEALMDVSSSESSDEESSDDEEEEEVASRPQKPAANYGCRLL